MEINGQKFMYGEVLYQAKIVDGKVVINNANEEVIPEADLTDSLTKAAVEALAAKPKFELITVREQAISRKLFATEEAAYTSMLEQLKDELKCSGEDEKTFDAIMEKLATDGGFDDYDLGVCKNTAWSRLGDNIDWRIFPLEAEPPIVNAEYNLWWDGGPSIATPCKINLRTKQVFAITDPEVNIDAFGTPDEEYVSFFGMEADVYERELLDHADTEALVFDEYWHE